MSARAAGRKYFPGEAECVSSSGDISLHDRPPATAYPLPRFRLRQCSCLNSKGGRRWGWLSEISLNVADIRIGSETDLEHGKLDVGLPFSIRHRPRRG